MKHFRIFAPDLAIDLGTANTIVARMDSGIVINEPTVVALDYKNLQILAIGKEAKALIGKSPENLAAIRPLQDGAISDFDLTQAMLEYYIHKALPGISLVAPRITISVPSGSTDVEQRAIQDACLQSGARDVYLVEETLACAYGAKLINDKTTGVMVLNIGAGTTEVAVVSSYGVITSETMKQGGDDLDFAVKEHIREKYGLIIGDNTAENIKNAIGTLHADKQNNAMEVSGRDTVSGMPKNIDIYASDITGSMMHFVERVVDRVRFTLEKTPPELAADITKKGLLLTGGASQIDGLAEYIESKIDIRVRSSEHPLEDTINGAVAIMKNIDQLKTRGQRNDQV